MHAFFWAWPKFSCPSTVMVTSLWVKHLNILQRDVTTDQHTNYLLTFLLSIIHLLINLPSCRKRRSKFSELVPNPFAERSCNRICSNQTYLYQRKKTPYLLQYFLHPENQTPQHTDPWVGACPDPPQKVNQGRGRVRDGPLGGERGLCQPRLQLREWNTGKCILRNLTLDKQ